MSANERGKLTPLMQQYWEIKSQHPDKVLLFRMGDFFEMFHEDAITAAPILNIALTQRNKKAADETPMCGVPHHSIAGPIAKLLAAGHKVAICDQVEDPKLAKGLVKRAITRILSPGMVYDPETLDELSANYLACYDRNTLAYLDVSTGEAFYYSFNDFNDAEKILTLLPPAELVLSSEQKCEFLRRGKVTYCLTAHEFNATELPSLYQELPKSCQRLVAYAAHMQGPEIFATLNGFEPRGIDRTMTLTQGVIRQLEIFETYRGEGKGSLYSAVNRTMTSAGARLLKRWLSFPSTDPAVITSRWDQVQWWVERPTELKELRQVFSRMGDIERRLGKIANPNCHARDLLALAQSLRSGIAASRFRPGLMDSNINVASDLAQLIEQHIVDEPPLSVKEGGIIRRGLSAQLDELVELAEQSQNVLLQMEAQEKQKTGISSLKIRYNNVFGFYIEITHSHRDKVPDHYKRKQTLANAERYVTQELQELEDRILSARSKRAELEYEIFSSLRQKILKSVPDLLVLSRRWSELDVLSSLAWLALENKYARPEISPSSEFRLVNCRHPVLEQDPQLSFRPNTIELKPGQCMLLTGPNMAGKSTIMRQAATIAILAQMGSFVPAEKAEIKIFDRIFTRIGASDSLNEGLSTFMVEMKESAEMLACSTKNSLVIVDEIGRGTATYDGMSLAQAILEHLVTKVGAITFFATHYHELTLLSRQFPQIENYHMAINEKGSEISFLYTLKKGSANKSYGVQVARLAGLPPSVVQRASLLLKRLEAGALTTSSAQMLLIEQTEDELPKNPWDDLLEEIRQAAVQKMTPLEALNKIAQWQQHLS